MAEMGELALNAAAWPSDATNSNRLPRQTDVEASLSHRCSFHPEKGVRRIYRRKFQVS